MPSGTDDPGATGQRSPGLFARVATVVGFAAALAGVLGFFGIGPPARDDPPSTTAPAVTAAPAATGAPSTAGPAVATTAAPVAATADAAGDGGELVLAPDRGVDVDTGRELDAAAPGVELVNVSGTGLRYDGVPLAGLVRLTARPSADACRTALEQPSPALSLVDLRGSRPGDTYCLWTGEGRIASVELRSVDTMRLRINVWAG
jgi:hypothetical protein